MRRLLTTGACCVALSTGCYVGGDPSDDLDDGRGGGNTRSYAGFLAVGGNFSVALPSGAAFGPLMDFAQDDAPQAVPAPPELVDAYWDGLDPWADDLAATWCELDSPSAPGQCDQLCNDAFMTWDGTVTAVEVAPMVMTGPDFSTVDVITTNPFTGIDEVLACSPAEPCLESWVEYDNAVIPAPECACNCVASFGTGGGPAPLPGGGSSGGTGW